MPADPFTIAGVFGLTAGLIGFVASTIEKTASQIATVKCAHQRMQGYQENLKSCQDCLEAWVRQWHGEQDEPHTEEELTFLWGQQGFEDVEKKLVNIVAEQRGLLKLLHGSELTQCEYGECPQQWGLFVRNTIQNARPPESADSNMGKFVEQLSISLWKNNLVSSTINRLKDHVSELESTSCIRFHQAQGITSSHHSTQPSPDDIERCLRQRHRTTDLVRALRTAYEGLRRPHERFCELLLTPFSETEEYRLERQHELTLAFLSVCPIACSIGVC